MSGGTVPDTMPAAGQPGADDRSERLLRVLALATFIIFFQAFMVAPIIPQLATIFGAPAETVGLIVPAYLIPYGVATLAYGLLADRLGIRVLMFTSLAAFAVLTILTATAHSVAAIAGWRVLTGLGASGVGGAARARACGRSVPLRAARPFPGLAVRRHGRRHGVRLHVRRGASPSYSRC